MAQRYVSGYSPRPVTVPINPKTIDPLLHRLLTLCTPHGHEKHIVRVINEQPFVKDLNVEEIEGNVIIKVGDNPTTLFSCHMDIVGTVGTANAKAGNVDAITLMTPNTNKETDRGIIYGSKSFWNDKEQAFTKYEPSTLGADDKVGCWILLKLISHKIPGLYVFHVGEECGGIGSKFLVTNHASRFEGLKRAIAFDRADYSDVICFQRGGRCCSDEFGKELAEALNVNMPPFERFKSGVTGSFTDTANYREIIPECTNISVGYFSQHGPSEHLDYIWLKHILLPAILKINFENLITKRDPKEKPTYSYTNNWNQYSGQHNPLRKSWKEADKDTKEFDLPLWNPSLGYVVDAKDDVLRRAIIKHVGQCYSMDEKKNLSEYIISLLEMNELLKDEVISQSMQIKLLINKGKHGKVESLDLVKKKKFLAELIEVSQVVTLEYHNNHFQAYAKGGTKFLEIVDGRVLEEQFPAKELKKLNRIIFMMAYYLSINTLKDETIAELLNEIHQYITLHITEDGFSGEPIKIADDKRIKALH